jgi:micrococcal nuclease
VPRFGLRPAVLLGLGLVVALAAWLALSNPRGGGQPELTPVPNAVVPNGVVVRVVDGDTVQITVNGSTESVRLIGVDTPETVDERKPVQCYGPEASAHTKQLLPAGTAVHIERDAEVRDKYGRLLAYVYRSSDGLFVNLELVTGGYGSVLAIKPNVTYESVFRDAEATARQRGIGLWGTCGRPGLAATPSTTTPP